MNFLSLPTILAAIIVVTASTTIVAFGPPPSSSIGRRQQQHQLSMALGRADLTRRQKLNDMFDSVFENPTKEFVESTLLGDNTNELIEKCNWKLRKVMIRKVKKVAGIYGVEVDDGFGVPLNQEEWEAKMREESVSYIAAKQAKADAAAEVARERRERKAAKKARKVAALAV
mmetsp:Transcript_18134/g.20926  ORF Transcript_18134/g.20926 Transcript_18134/m.20926 type:complete len:172 (+) Transcript_18134:127-642(+)|eukprot:CAMPEP_0194146472 /NCGR_PEP_ID=MMETSP0152-20130528/20615_1 /TAXON_ID=1049557 /ORGANISM="Thalassiothrix antarctica, Strain L6-D1" /LENGTH=171 /DNA_ID=CAMNT_0038847001 /DNA_START=73 /DNA_END=588 /DNA_ORIENTATION=-